MAGRKGAAALKLVKAAAAPAIDIYAADRAKIATTDWATVHIRGDRSAAVEIPDRPKRKAFGMETWR